MADTWSIADGVVTLTLDGSGSGERSRSRVVTGLEPNELYTFYLDVTQSDPAIGAFLASLVQLSALLLAATADALLR